MQYNKCSQHCADLQEEPLHIEVCTACPVLCWCLVGSGLVARGAKEGDWGVASLFGYPWPRRGRHCFAEEDLMNGGAIGTADVVSSWRGASRGLGGDSWLGLRPLQASLLASG